MSNNENIVDLMNECQEWKDRTIAAESKLAEMENKLKMDDDDHFELQLHQYAAGLKNEGHYVGILEEHDDGGVYVVPTVNWNNLPIGSKFYLDNVSQQEPVAYGIYSDTGHIRIWWLKRNGDEGVEIEHAKEWAKANDVSFDELTPLYLHPKPSHIPEDKKVVEAATIRIRRDPRDGTPEPIILKFTDLGDGEHKLYAKVDQ